MQSEIEIYINDLKQTLPEGFVLSAAQRQLVKEAFSDSEGQVKISKKTKLSNKEMLSRSVIKDSNGQLWALLGFTREIPQGAQGTLKVAQNLETGEFCLVKIAKIKGEEEQYKQKEASEEAKHLHKRGLLLGVQYRDKLTKKHDYKHYNFIKILPGVKFKGKGKCAYAELEKNPPIEMCTLIINMLLKLNELKKESVIHRDLHGGNILIDLKRLECTIIDFGTALTANEQGYAYGKGVGDIAGTGPTLRFANGMDFEDIYLNVLFAFIEGNKTLESIFESLYAQAFEIDTEGKKQYNPVDLEPAIKEIMEYQKSLQVKKGHGLKK
jgi:serine/threonine protein kinase